MEHGFVRLYCKDCHAEKVVGFYCKGRGFCPPCGARRAIQKADRIEREVWPQAKARQWVLTFPHQVRFWLLRRPKLFNEVISIVVDSIAVFYEQHSAAVFGQDQIYLPTAGSISFVQFFGSGTSVIYVDGNGYHVLYSNGTRTWRNNNPGNLRPGTVSRRNGQIGVAGRFAVFPDYEAGHAAHIDLLINVYGNRDLAAWHAQLQRLYRAVEQDSS